MKIQMFILFTILLFVLFGCNNEKNNELNHNEMENNNELRDGVNEIDENHGDIDSKEGDETTDLLLQIYESAKGGKLYGTNWIVGEVRADDIEEKWGKGDKLDEVAGGFYVTYDEEKIVFGMDEFRKIYDLRTYSEDLKAISEKKMKEVLGEPHDIRSFDEDSILVYKINEYYELKFIFPPIQDGANERYLSHVNIVYLPWAPATVGTFPIIENVESLIDKMSLEEKVGQLIITGIEGPGIDNEIQNFIQEKHVGAVILLGRNIQNAKQMENLVKNIKNLNRSHIPLFIGVDEEGGRITRFPKEIIPTPTKREIGGTNNSNIAFKLGKLIGEKTSSFGINMNFSPVLDIDSNPNNPVIGDRSYGSTPEIVKEYGTNEMLGLAETGVIPVIKHFPGHGDTELDSHIDLPLLTHTKERMYSFELLPFIHAINKGADSVMVGHLVVSAFDEQYPASMSKALISDLLRHELQFDGVIMTDDMTMGAILENYEIGEAAVQSIKAGSDLILINHGYDNTARVIEAIMEAVQNGEITESRINLSVERILTLKKVYAITDDSSFEVNVSQLNNKIKAFLDKLNNE